MREANEFKLQGWCWGNAGFTAIRNSKNRTGAQTSLL